MDRSHTRAPDHSAAGINIGNNDIGYANCHGRTPIPGTSPVDFNCDGNQTDTGCASGCNLPFMELNNNNGATPNGTPGSGDVLQPFEDWPNLIFNFQAFGIAFRNGMPLDIGEVTGPAKVTGATLNQTVRREINPVRSFFTLVIRIWRHSSTR